ncbi:MAG: hypothetical protein GY749_46500 [Desulfobacteraceae bacterium]|nr:hypothetical protein [Desulfobacteraceae bacterium]
MNKSDFQFLGYHISKINCEIKDSYDPEKIRISQTIEVRQNYFQEEKRFVEVVMDVKLKSEDESFYFFISMKGRFRGGDDMPQEIFERFSGRNAPAIMYPFVRSIITSYTAQANIPPVILPTVNFASKHDSQEDNNGNN